MRAYCEIVNKKVGKDYCIQKLYGHECWWWDLCWS